MRTQVSSFLQNSGSETLLACPVFWTSSYLWLETSKFAHSKSFSKKHRQI